MSHGRLLAKQRHHSSIGIEFDAMVPLAADRTNPPAYNKKGQENSRGRYAWQEMVEHAPTKIAVDVPQGGADDASGGAAGSITDGESQLKQLKKDVAVRHVVDLGTL